MTGHAADHLLVGLGFDEDGRAELTWAATEAGARGVALHVIRAYDFADVVRLRGGPPDTAACDEIRGEADRAVEAALHHLHQQWPRVRATGTAVEGRASEVLLDRSRHAVLTVLGGRQLSTVGAALLGSVSIAVATGAGAPVVVVGRRSGDARPDAAVVVGVDDSAMMNGVLRFAFEYANRHERELHAVACWRHSVEESIPWSPSNLAHQAEHRLDEALLGWRDKYPQVKATRTVEHGPAVGGLVSAAAGHDLLVVGSGSRRSHLSALLGSVTQGVLHQARCPVAVVPGNCSADS